jgi:hypothetical protein
MKLLITTQVRENYGAHDWDGVGECPQYWKSKGGNDYVLRDFKGSDGQADRLRLRSCGTSSSPTMTTSWNMY